MELGLEGKHIREKARRAGNKKQEEGGKGKRGR